MMVIPGVYQHYKGGRYLVIGTARHHETGAKYVIYTPLEPHLGGEGVLEWNIRPEHGNFGDQDGWLNSVTDGEGREVPRFRLVYPLKRLPQ